MLCPCCGNEIQPEARQCGCGARFVGAPLDEKPVHIPSYGAVMNSLGLLALVVAGALVFTKFIALGAVLVIWSARRAMKLAKHDPQSYGGFKVAAATLVVTLVAGSVAAGYSISYIPRFLANRQERKAAATRATMYRLAQLLDKYRLANGAYPDSRQKLQAFAKEPIPADFWEQAIRYTGFTEGLAEVGLPRPKSQMITEAMVGGGGRGTTEKASRITLHNFELRSNGPDGVADTEDDIIMRDGIFYTAEEVKKMASLKVLAEQ